MPDVAGMTLDVALVAIADAGVSQEVDVEGGGLFGVVEEANWTVCAQVPAAGAAVSSAPQVSVDRSCEDDIVEASATPTPEPASESADPTPTPTPAESNLEAEPYVYEGPQYTVVTKDPGVGMGVLDQYWVLTQGLDTSTDAYQQKVKLIISDVAYNVGTDSLIVQVVTDGEIVEAESASTIADFIGSHDDAYWNEVMVPKEAAHWVATYTGGIDYNAGELSNGDSAFGIDWWPYGDYSYEQWKPPTVS